MLGMGAERVGQDEPEEDENGDSRGGEELLCIDEAAIPPKDSLCRGLAHGATDDESQRDEKLERALAMEGKRRAEMRTTAKRQRLHGAEPSHLTRQTITLFSAFGNASRLLDERIETLSDEVARAGERYVILQRKLEQRIEENRRMNEEIELLKLSILSHKRHQ